MQPLAARAVYSSLQHWAGEGGNAVLDVLANADGMRQGTHYPAEALRFGDGAWRAYYHSHPEGLPAPEEHGHFHIFVRAPEVCVRARPWAHVAALSIDAWGQPLRWFSVNAWVTDDAWAPAAELLAAIDALQPERETGRVETWLTGLLQLFRPELAALLASRDRFGANADSLTERLTDRDNYLLSERTIDLAARLTTSLSAAQE